MKKVIYSITKLGKVENTKVTGVGYITVSTLGSLLNKSYPVFFPQQC